MGTCFQNPPLKWLHPLGDLEPRGAQGELRSATDGLGVQGRWVHESNMATTRVTQRPHQKHRFWSPGLGEGTQRWQA